MKLKTTLITLLFAGSLSAATTANNTSTTSSNWYDQLRESPHGMTIISLNQLPRINNTAKVRAITSYNYIYNTYKFNKDYKLTLENVIKRSNPQFSDPVTDHYRTTFSLKRSNILTQAEHGTDLSASVNYRYFPEFDFRRDKNLTSHVRGIVTQGVTYGSLSLSNSLLLYAKQFNRDSSLADAKTSKYYFDLIQSYAITDKFSFYLEEEIIFQNTNKGVGEGSDGYLTAAVSYSFNKILSADFGVDSQFAAGHDGTFIKNDFGKLSSLGYTATATISMF